MSDIPVMTTCSEGNRLTDAIRLWPDPFDAPDVPDRETLGAYLDNPTGADPDLAEQLRESVNARRALEALRVERGDHPASDLLESIPLGQVDAEPDWGALTARLNALLPQQKGTLLPPRFSEADRFLQPQPGQVWLTTDAVQVWQEGRLVRRRTNEVPLALITESADRMENGDDVARGVAVSPAAHWPDGWIASDEIRVTTDRQDPYVAHVWLEYPISRRQLLRPLAVLDEASLENLLVAVRARQQGLPLTEDERCGRTLDARADAPVLLERERLAVRASWLGATAQSLRLAAEAAAGGQAAAPSEEGRVLVDWLRAEDAHEEKDGFRLAAADERRAAPARTASFKVAGADAELELSLDTDGERVSFLVFGADGRFSPVLDGAVVEAAGKDSPPFSGGMTNMPKADLACGFSIRRTAGERVGLERR